MPLYIEKNPNPQTLLSRVYADACPAGHTVATEAEASAWEAAQLAAGWAPAPIPTADEPREVSKLTLRRRLRALGKESLFDATLDAVPNARRDWDDAQILRTDDPLFTTQAPAVRAALGLSAEQFASLVA